MEMEILMPSINDPSLELLRKIRAETQRGLEQEREANEQRALINSLNKIQRELRDLNNSRERQEENIFEHQITDEQKMLRLGFIAFTIFAFWAFFRWGYPDRVLFYIYFVLVYYYIFRTVNSRMRPNRLVFLLVY